MGQLLNPGIRLLHRETAALPPRETHVVRSATLQGYDRAAVAVGLDPEVMLRRVGLSIPTLEEHDTMISVDTFLELLAMSARESNCLDFGVRAAAARGVPDLGPVSLLMREAETLEDALGIYHSHLALHSDSTFIKLDTRFENPLITMEVVAASREHSVQATQFCATGVITQIRWLMGGDFQPDLVAFSHSRPANSRYAQQFFQCPVSYNQLISGVVISRDLLARPLATSLPFLRKQSRQHVHPAISRVPNSFGTKVSQIIRQMLPEGTCTVEGVATYFDVDRRTLNRRLDREGETFSSLRRDVRRDIARRAILGENCSLTELSDMTGFESLSSFSRWFQKNFGCTASEYRRNNWKD